MGKYRRLVLASVIGLTFQKLQAQKEFALLEKNHNVRAKDLSHELNASKDTLILNSPKIIDYVYAINRDYKREIDFYNNTNSLKIPLNQLSKGKHVFVVGSSRMQIVFVVRVLDEKTKLAMVTNNKVTTSGN
ncbi:MAG: hypothetical protein R2797_05410 [Gelidibacter sp.]